MKKENLIVGYEFMSPMVWGQVKYTITRITNKCVFCTCIKVDQLGNILEIETTETRFDKDHLLNTFFN